MGELIRIAGTADVKPGAGMVAEVNGKAIALFNVEGAFFCHRQYLRPSGRPAGRRGGGRGCGNLPVAQLAVQRKDRHLRQQSLGESDRIRSHG